MKNDPNLTKPLLSEDDTEAFRGFLDNRLHQKLLQLRELQAAEDEVELLAGYCGLNNLKVGIWAPSGIPSVDATVEDYRKFKARKDLVPRGIRMCYETLQRSPFVVQETSAPAEVYGLPVYLDETYVPGAYRLLYEGEFICEGCGFTEQQGINSLCGRCCTRRRL